MSAMSVSEFLASMPMFSGVPREQLDNLASSLREIRYKIGDLVLTQGETSDALYILRSGHLAVRVNRLDARETVALLQPPAIFGELSMITGKTCSADVEVVVDANVLVLPHVAFDNLAASHSELLRGMVQMLGERLHTTNVRGAIAAEPVVALLRVERSWAAPAAFSDELGRSLARQMNADTLVVR